MSVKNNMPVGHFRSADAEYDSNKPNNSSPLATKPAIDEEGWALDKSNNSPILIKVLTADEEGWFKTMVEYIRSIFGSVTPGSLTDLRLKFAQVVKNMLNTVDKETMDLSTKAFIVSLSERTKGLGMTQRTTELVAFKTLNPIFNENNFDLFAIKSLIEQEFPQEPEKMETSPFDQAEVSSPVKEKEPPLTESDTEEEPPLTESDTEEEPLLTESDTKEESRLTDVVATPNDALDTPTVLKSEAVPPSKTWARRSVEVAAAAGIVALATHEIYQLFHEGSPTMTEAATASFIGIKDLVSSALNVQEVFNQCSASIISLASSMFSSVELPQATTMSSLVRIWEENKTFVPEIQIPLNLTMNGSTLP